VARLGRGQPNRPLFVHPRLGQRHADVALPVWETVSEWPGLDVTTPDARFELPVWETLSEWPALDVRKHAYPALPVWETISEWPDLTVSVPTLPGDLITADFMIEWGGLVFGGIDNVYQIVGGSVEGWEDMPELVSGNAPRAARHGSWPGRDYLNERIVSAVVAISGPEDSEAFTLASRNLRRAMGISASGTESFLAIRTAGETLIAEAKADGRIQPTQHYGQRFTAVQLRWRCSDPTRLDLHQQSVLVPIDGSDSCDNEGDLESRPVIRIRGPVTNPVVTNVTLERILRFDITVPDGSRFDIDTKRGTATIGTEDHMDKLSNQSVPVEEWVLAAGENTVSFSADSDGNNGAEILFRSSYT
jgi:hypothetical protein